MAGFYLILYILLCYNFCWPALIVYSFCGVLINLLDSGSSGPVSTHGWVVLCS